LSLIDFVQIEVCRVFGFCQQQAQYADCWLNKGELGSGLRAVRQCSTSNITGNSRQDGEHLALVIPLGNGCSYRCPVELTAKFCRNAPLKDVKGVNI
jgi:hypothetical protein